MRSRELRKSKLSYKKSMKVIKKYMYDTFKVTFIIIFFPIVFILSFLCSRLFIPYLFKYKREGVTKQGHELNTWEQVEYDVKTRGIKDFAIRKENVEEIIIGSEIGKVSALQVINPENKSNKWVIGLHGFKRNKYIGLRNCNFFYKKGYNILTFDAYAHGKTFGKKSDFGVTNAKILNNIVTWIKSTYNPEEIGIVGVSMGASTGLLFAKDYYQQNKVNWLIADCPFIEAVIQIRFFLKKYVKLPWIFMSLAINRNFKKYAKSDISKMNLFNGYENFKELPILYLHGYKDRFITYNCSVVMFNLKKEVEEKPISDIVLFDNADHSSCYHKNEQQYVEQVFNFISKASA
ncbi:hydrolase [Spiroplasma helicoides]|uniref:Hydrolase n=1 Tax=Spiroplasma helicoides TaxID=216938 RepID=A0A1B3SJA9_9MOLU|nr:alpha/beta fold hydrolase [Spiroplasma helicoides]AOG60015.1 hydrolase [Spiroplasma helicoides]